jgi:hypothetical protein
MPQAGHGLRATILLQAINRHANQVSVSLDNDDRLSGMADDVVRDRSE